MKILIISNLYPSRETPHYGSFVKNFEEQLKEDPRVNSLRGIFLKGLNKGLFNKVIKYLIFYIKILFYLSFYNFDLIYVHLITHSTLPIKLISKIKRLNIIFNIHGEDLLVTTPLAKKLLDLALPLVYNARYVVVPSYYFKEITELLLPKLDPTKLIISPSAGIKPIFFNKEEKKFDNEKLVFGYVSRIDRGKGWDTLIDALKILQLKGITPEVKIAGNGPEISELKNLITKNNLTNVQLVGSIPHNNLPEFYSKLDCFIFPTKLRESLGLVGLEAMAGRIPVIGSRIGGLNDYIKNEINGFFFEPNNPNDLAEKIYKFIKLPELEKTCISDAAFKTALKYEASLVASELFDTILKNIYNSQNAKH